jgi:hypothetical protein
MTELKRAAVRARKLSAWSVLTVVTTLAFASLGVAAPNPPKGKYTQFENCPLGRKTITICVYSASTGGFFTIGKRTVPINNTVTVQGGFEGAGSEIKFFGAKNGETLSKAPQPVPGGLNGVTAPSWWPGWLQEAFNESLGKGKTNVTATLELAAPPTSIKLNTENLIEEKGTALGLPVKIKLENPLLGGNCYIGSNKDPIQIDFTTGKSGEVKGSTGKPSVNQEATFTTFSGGRLVNNTFSAPGASGCGGMFSFFFDPLIDSLLSTPSVAGQNTAILEGNFQAVAAINVRASE